MLLLLSLFQACIYGVEMGEGWSNQIKKKRREKKQNKRTITVCRRFVIVVLCCVLPWQRSKKNEEEKSCQRFKIDTNTHTNVTEITTS